MNFCADSAFFIALYDDHDQHHVKAVRCFSGYLSKPANRLLIPWPSVYESLSTRMVRRPAAVMAIARDWTALRRNNQLVFLDDSPFRKGALEECFSETSRSAKAYRSLSVVDRVIRGLLADRSTRVHALLTFNARDFFDVCKKFRKDILPY